jgi:dolichol-phosphate mannosyltransferase
MVDMLTQRSEPDVEGQDIDLSVILPAYGEATNLSRLLPLIQETIKTLKVSGEVLVVDASSPIDDTMNVCNQNQVIWLPRRGGNSYGDALRTGIEASQGHYLVVMDADGSHNPDFIRTLWANRLDNDLVIASRYVHGGHTDNPFQLVLFSRILNWLFKLFVGIPVLDVSNSFRLYRGNTIRGLQLVRQHFDIMEEILVKMIWNASADPVRILELPFRFGKRESGKSKRNLFVFGLNFMLAMYHLRRYRILSQKAAKTAASNKNIGRLTPGATRDQNIKLLVSIILIGLFSALLFCYWKGYGQGLPYPYNTFLFRPSARFSDYSDTLRRVKDLNPYLGKDVSLYYPFLNFVSYLLSLIPDVKQSYEIYTLIISLVFVLINYYYLRSNKIVQSIIFVLIVSLLNYPTLFTFDRGNLEGLTFIFLLLFMFFFEREEYATSTIFIAFATASKLFPGVFLLLYLSKKKYREFAFSVFLTGLLTVAPLLAFRGGLANNFDYLLRGENLNIPSFAVFIGDNNIVQRGVTLFTLSKIIMVESGAMASTNMQYFLRTYIVVAMGIFSAVAAYVLFVETELWKQITVLTIAMLILPQFSADYRLIYIFIPLLLYLNIDRRPHLDIAYLIVFGLLLIPKSYFFLTKIVSDSGTSDISIAVILNPLLMILICTMIVGSGIRNWLSARRSLAAGQPKLPNLSAG